MESPLIILLELFTGLIAATGETVRFVGSKLVELFISLGFMATIGPIGFVIAVAIASAVILFAMKFFLGSSRTMLLVGIGIAAVFVFLLIVGSV